jgi:hypothetical protein
MCRRQLFEIAQVLGPPGRALHGPEVLERAHLDDRLAKRHAEGVTIKVPIARCAGSDCMMSRRPYFVLKTKLPRSARPRGSVGWFGSWSGSSTPIIRASSSPRALASRSSFSELGRGTMSRAFVALTTPWTPTAMPPITTKSTSLLVRCSSSRSGSNIVDVRRQTRSLAQLAREPAEPERFLEQFFGRALRVVPQLAQTDSRIDCGEVTLLSRIAHAEKSRSR